MMNQIKSARVQAIRFLFVLPLLAVLLLAFREVRHQNNKPHFDQAAVLHADTIPASDIEAIRVIKNNNEQSIKITLKNGTKETYDLNDETEKAAFEKKYGKLENKVPPPPPEIKIVKFDPVPPKVELNEKGFYVSIADNEGECIVIVKDKKKNIVEALKLTDWTKNEATYEKKYGKIPPPPPPAPPAPASVSVVSPVATTAIVSAPVKISTTASVSPVNEVAVVGYATKTTNAPVVVEGKQIKGTLTPTSPTTGVEEVVVTGYATKTTNAPVVVEGKQIKGTIKSASPSSDVKEVTVAGYGTASTGAKVVFEGKSSVNGTGSSSTKTGNLRLPFGYGVNTDNVLYVLDGQEIEYGKLSDLDPNTIDAITILKGESAISLYGKKGENGVIIIKTKTKKTSVKFLTFPWQEEKEKC